MTKRYNILAKITVIMRDQIQVTKIFTLILSSIR